MRQLKTAREDAGLTQRQMADRLEHHQAFVSRCETGERRMDVVELRAYCKALKIPLREFIDHMEGELEIQERMQKRKGRGTKK